MSCVTRGRPRYEWWHVLSGIKALRFASTPRCGAAALTPPALVPESSYGDRSRVGDAVQISTFSDGCQQEHSHTASWCVGAPVAQPLHERFSWENGRMIRFSGCVCRRAGRDCSSRRRPAFSTVRTANALISGRTLHSPIRAPHDRRSITGLLLYPCQARSCETGRGNGAPDLLKTRSRTLLLKARRAPPCGFTAFPDCSNTRWTNREPFR